METSTPRRALAVFWTVIALLRDEFERHIQFVALSIAYPASLALTFAFAYARGEGWFAKTDLRDLPFCMIAVYFISYLFASRRLQ